MNFRLGAYRAFHRHWTDPVTSLLFSLRQANSSLPRAETWSASQSGSWWFHGASAGELEAIWSLVTGTGGNRERVALSAFSRSASSALARLREEVGRISGELPLTGLSPWEGSWRGLLERVEPKVFVTAKYEAWPDLWASLAELGIPLVIVGARARSSLRIGNWACKSLGSPLPRMLLLPVGAEDVAPLRALFPDAEIEALGDARWDRVWERASRGNPRASELVARHQGSARPWGILGSVWPEDLEVWGDLLKDPTQGTKWIVPHRVDRDSLNSLERVLHQRGIKTQRTSSGPEPRADRCVLVDEMGFLSELYAAADWVYIGGGFSRGGIHSTIEPAIRGVPVACGPTKIGRFPETADLRGTGQLRVVQDQRDLAAWLSECPEMAARSKAGWLAQAEARLGATNRILRKIESWLPH